MEVNQTIEVHKKKGKIWYLDILRAIAIITVIMIHASCDYVGTNFASLDNWTGNLLNSLCRVCVPIFVMISGALFLDENYNFTFKKLFTHLLRMVIFFFVWSLLYALIYQIIIPLSEHQNINVQLFFEYLILGHYQLWFCFLIINLYLIVPLLRLWVKKDK